MTLCPIALVAGCQKCPVFKVCPVKSIIGDMPKAGAAKSPVAKSPAAKAATAKSPAAKAPASKAAAARKKK